MLYKKLNINPKALAAYFKKNKCKIVNPLQLTTDQFTSIGDYYIYTLILLYNLSITNHPKSETTI